MTITLPEGAEEIPTPGAPTFIPSPDGRSIVFAARDVRTGKDSLWLRSTGSAAVRQLQNAEGANFPFWSPDSQHVGYFAERALRRVNVQTGAVATICDLPGPAINRASGGASWSAGNIVIFQTRGALQRVAAGGGAPTPATELDRAAREHGHSWPQFLPGGKRFLYLARHDDPQRNAIYVQELGSKTRTLVLNTQTRAQYASPGFMLFMREGSLFAQRFSPVSMKGSGEPSMVEREITSNNALGRAAFAVSNGLLVFRSGDLDTKRQLTWYDRAGTRLGTIGKAGNFANFTLSPDEETAAVMVTGMGGVLHTWIMKLSSGAMKRLTADVRQSNRGVVWSPDSKRILYSRSGAGLMELNLAAGTFAEIVESANVGPVWDWSPDGRYLITGGAGKNFLLPLKKGPPSEAVPAALDFRISPDCKRVAFASAESGRQEVYVAAFPSFKEQQQLSSEGGAHPEWNGDSKELFYQALDGTLMSATWKGAGPAVLFKVKTSVQSRQYAPLSKGKKFLVLERVGADTAQITVVSNWDAGLK